MFAAKIIMFILFIFSAIGLCKVVEFMFGLSYVSIASTYFIIGFVFCIMLGVFENIGEEK